MGADPEKVLSETTDASRVMVETAVMIGWNAEGRFLVHAPTLDPFRVLALLKKAEGAIMALIPSDNPRPLVVPSAAMPPPLELAR